MSLYVIARIGQMNSNGKWVNRGYKIFNTKTKDFKCMTVSDIKQHKLKLENATIDGEELKGTQGDLSRYTPLNFGNMKPVAPCTMVILGKDSDGNYVLINHPEREDNLLVVVSPKELKREVIRQTMMNGDKDSVIIANAAIKNRDNLKNIVISAISGTFDNVIIQYPRFIEQVFEFDNYEQMDAIKNWMVRVVRPNERYGRNYCLVNESSESLVEFYSLGDYRVPNDNGDLVIDEKKKQDLREAFPIGQFVSRYYLSTLLEHNLDVGLSLEGSVKSWTLYADAFAQIYGWLISLKIK